MSFGIDANILLYASDQGSPRAAEARRFLEDCARNGQPFALAWPTLMAYLRIATHPKIFQ